MKSLTVPPIGNHGQNVRERDSAVAVNVTGWASVAAPVRKNREQVGKSNGGISIDIVLTSDNLETARQRGGVGKAKYDIRIFSHEERMESASHTRGLLP